MKRLSIKDSGTDSHQPNVTHNSDDIAIAGQQNAACIDIPSAVLSLMRRFSVLTEP
jgi:hypothetical protein